VVGQRVDCVERLRNGMIVHAKFVYFLDAAHLVLAEPLVHGVVPSIPRVLELRHDLNLNPHGAPVARDLDHELQCAVPHQWLAEALVTHEVFELVDGVPAKEQLRFGRLRVVRHERSAAPHDVTLQRRDDPKPREVAEREHPFEQVVIAFDAIRG
jgi:hypothetical protein